MNQPSSAPTLSQQIGALAGGVEAGRLPARAREVNRLLLIDIAGLRVAARATEFVENWEPPRCQCV